MGEPGAEAKFTEERADGLPERSPASDAVNSQRDPSAADKFKVQRLDLLVDEAAELNKKLDQLIGLQTKTAVAIAELAKKLSAKT